jgi:asparagine synthase (glutamine-hydrolysing)
MCGICGIIRFDENKAKASDLTLMMQKQKHRGPNDESIFIDKNIGFGFVRLSIIDLSLAGRQPMHDKSGRYTLIFNGEIYNYIELREDLIAKGISFESKTDTEVLLNMYIVYGEECLNKLNGMFAFAIYDSVSGEVFAARDRFGVKPFYYFQDDKQFIFASEIPSILAVYNKKNKENKQAIFDYLAFNRTDQNESTFFEDIFKLQHGHYLTIKNKQIAIKNWYDLAKKIDIKSADINEYQKLLTDAVSIRMRSDVPVGVCLSGGLDSSSITSILTNNLNFKEIHTFSAIYEKGDRADESAFINLYKDSLHNMHFITPTFESLLDDLNQFIKIHAEPIPSTGPYAQYCVMKLAKNDVTVTLDGQGADEALGGYHYFFGFYFKDLLQSFKIVKLLTEIFYYLKVHKSLYGIKTFIYFLMPEKIKTKLRINERGYIETDFVNNILKQGKSNITNNLYASKNLKEALLNHFEFKLEHLLKWNDRNSMAFSIESRTPFLDYRLVEYTLSVKSDAIINKGFTKSILRESLKGILPEKIRVRTDKVGFATPQDEWFRTEQFQLLINEIINSESFHNRGFINSEKVKDLYTKHLNNEINIAKDIWKWVHLELWFREFIDKNQH